MEEKTRVLLQSVPNIHIRTRAEIEKGMSIYDDEKDGKQQIRSDYNKCIHLQCQLLTSSVLIQLAFTDPPFENKITIESKEQEITETTVDNFPDVIPPVADSDLVLKLPKVPDIWDPEIYNKNRSKLFDANVIER